MRRGTADAVLARGGMPPTRRLVMKTLVLAIMGALAALAPLTADAQEKTYLQRSVPSYEKALELVVATGYTQGFGQLDRATGLPRVAHAGIGVDVGAGYRVNPRWGVTLTGQYQELQAERAEATRGFAGTVAAQYHLDPNLVLDPWLELGAGYRALWETRPLARQDVLTHGVQVGRARIGLDVRVSPELAIAPVVGADATVFLWQDAGTTTAIADPRFSTFVFAGLQGRFDVGGNVVGTTRTTSTPAYAHRDR
jgi:hypothetical protein